jgi:hypothetical protein
MDCVTGTENAAKAFPDSPSCHPAAGEVLQTFQKHRKKKQPRAPKAGAGATGRRAMPS